jgi:hypothetical protein
MKPRVVSPRVVSESEAFNIICGSYNPITAEVPGIIQNLNGYGQPNNEPVKTVTVFCCSSWKNDEESLNLMEKLISILKQKDFSKLKKDVVFNITDIPKKHYTFYCFHNPEEIDVRCYPKVFEATDIDDNRTISFVIWM